MKKVLVLAAAIALLATPALADVVKNSKHNFSTTGPGSYKTTGSEICVYCHTPHNANTTAGTSVLPLWNRTHVQVTGAYNSATTENPTDLVQQNAATQIAKTDAPLCLSCHDGANMSEALQNPSNLDGALTIQSGANTNIVNGGVFQGNLGTNLNNDHPIGFSYNAVQTIEGAAGLKADPDAATAVQFFAGTDTTGASITDMMWCSSCHDVHNNANTPFLVVDNAASGLCTTCHQK